MLGAVERVNWLSRALASLHALIVPYLGDEGLQSSPLKIATNVFVH